MSISPGARLGPYEILSLLGAGGMGEVWRAKDTRLGRDVAVKVLPEDFLEGEERRQRFEREAKLLAALNHPNIASIHSFEEGGGRHLLVMEHVEGEALGKRMKTGPIPTREALSIGRDIASALEAAHAKGIVHRDLKPGNVMLSTDGRVKLLDFGLAKSFGESIAPEDLSHSPTLTDAGTATGVILGTAAYMSPEQARGSRVDARTDAWAFGVVLYELLTGKRLFRGQSTPDTLAAVLREPVDFERLPISTPHEVRALLKRCLERDPAKRLADIAEARRVLETATEARVGLRFPRLTLAAAAALLILLAAGGIFLVRRRHAGSGDAGAPKRIAVLPFENLGAAEDGYFADGMTDEVRSKLAGLSGLTVIASSSSGQYKATTKPPEQIARELGVGYLLVAKVRWQKSGSSSRIRVSPELVDVEGGGAPTTRWQEAFDADLSDVFKVQGDIAAQVAKSLDVVLSGKDRGALVARPTSNLAAYDAYLMAAEIAKGGDGTRKAVVAQLEQAVALDPGFALAWAVISMNHSILYESFEPSPQEAEATKHAAERAIALAPDLPESSIALAFYHSRVRRDDMRAIEILSGALKAAPNNISLLLGLTRVEKAAEKAVELLRRAEVLDPRSAGVQDLLATNLLMLRRGTEARAACDRGLALSPTMLDTIHSKVMSYLQEGDLAGARAVIAAAPAEVSPTALVFHFGTWNDLDWVLDDAHRDLLLRLMPAAFNDDRGNWGLVLAQAWSRRADEGKVRAYSEEARRSFAAKVAQDSGLALDRALLGLSLAYLGRKNEAVNEGERAIALLPIAKDAFSGPYLQHQLVRIHILCGNDEKAIDLLEPLLKVPYFLTPGWLRIDPNFDPLRENPRFQRLVARS